MKSIVFVLVIWVSAYTYCQPCLLFNQSPILSTEKNSDSLKLFISFSSANIDSISAIKILYGSVEGEGDLINKNILFLKSSQSFFLVNGKLYPEKSSVFFLGCIEEAYFKKFNKRFLKVTVVDHNGKDKCIFLKSDEN